MKTHFSDCMCILKQMFWTQWKTFPVFYIFFIVCGKIIALSEVVFYAEPMRADTSVRGPESQEGACEGPIALAIEVLFYISGFIGPKILNFNPQISIFNLHKRYSWKPSNVTVQLIKWRVFFNTKLGILQSD